MASAWRPRMAAGVGSREGPCSPHFGAGAQRRQSPRPRPPHRRSKRSGHGDGPGSHTQGPSCRIPRAATTASRMSCTCRRLRASSDLGVLDVRHVSGDGARQEGGTERDGAGSTLQFRSKFQKRKHGFVTLLATWHGIIPLLLQTPRALGIVSASIRRVRFSEHLCECERGARCAHILCANCQILFHGTYFTEHVVRYSIDRSSPLPYTRHP